MSLIEDTCKMPVSTQMDSTELLHRVKSLAAEDHVSVMNEVAVRIGEFRERRDLLSFGESVELAYSLKRLEACEEKLSAIFDRKVPMDSFWGLMRELGKYKLGKEEGEEKMAAATVESRVGRGGELAQHGGRRGSRSTELVKFPSGRLLSLPISSSEQ